MIDKDEVANPIETGSGTKCVVGKATEKSGKPNNRANDVE